MQHSDQSLYHKLRFTGCTVFWKTINDAWCINEFKTADKLQTWWNGLRRSQQGRANRLVHIDFPDWEQLALGLPGDECLILDGESKCVWPPQLAGIVFDKDLLSPENVMQLLDLTK